MGLLTETELLAAVDPARSAFLLEPPWSRKYAPLGLDKLAARVRSNGGSVRYGRSFDGAQADVVLVTSLFTYSFDQLVNEVLAARAMAPDTQVIVGGPAATLVPKQLVEATGADVFVGVSRELDQLVPDQEVNWQLDDEWSSWCWVFTSRGCSNSCPYCAVWRMERDGGVVPGWEDHLIRDKQNVMVSDNNLLVWGVDHLRAVVDVARGRRQKLCFDNGFDAAHIDDEAARVLARAPLVRHRLRLAFDRIEEDGVFQGAVERLKAAGAPSSQMMVYVLFNYRDTPREACYRMEEVWRLGARPYPQRYTPLRALNREPVHVGKHWTLPLLKAFRRFWLMAGDYQRKRFADWIETPEVREEWRLSDEDMDCWRSSSAEGEGNSGAG